MKTYSVSAAIALLIILAFAPWWASAQRPHSSIATHMPAQGRYVLMPATVWVGGRDIPTVVRINTDNGTSWYAAGQAEGLTWVPIREPLERKAAQ